MSADPAVLDELQKLVGEHAQQMESYWDDDVRPHAARLLTEAATVAVRASAGEDTSVAQIALDASLKNLTRVQQAVLQLRARDLALKAALSVIGKIAAG